MKIQIWYISLTIALYAIGAPSGSWAESTICQSQMANWLNRYGASDPYMALQKTTPWSLSRPMLNQLGGKDIEFDEPILSQFQISSAQLQSEAKVAFINSLKDIDPPTARDLAIRANLLRFVGSSGQLKSELALAYVGLAHAIDLYLVAPQSKATYVNKPFSTSTLTIPEGRRELEAALGMKSPPRKVGEAIFAYYRLPYQFTAETMRAENLRASPAGKTYHLRKFCVAGPILLSSVIELQS